MGTLDALIDRQLRRWEFERTHGYRSPMVHAPPPARRSVITMSRQHGTNGVAIAEHLAARLHYTLLHRDAIDRMCESTGITRRLYEALEEHARSQLRLWVESMIAGRIVEPADYTRALLHVILPIAELGGVVVVGRGANFILGSDRGFHLRVVAPRAARIRALMERKSLGARDASREVDRVDHERGDFTRRVFRRKLDDPLGYDVTLHSLDTPPEALSVWLAEAARAKFARLAATRPPARAPLPDPRPPDHAQGRAWSRPRDSDTSH